MKNAIILHGVRDYDEPESSMSNAHWLPWIKQEFENRGIKSVVPEFPNATVGKAVYEEWLCNFPYRTIDKNTILIGHSAGAGFLLKYLSLNTNVKCAQLILVAPWLDLEKLGGEFLQDFQLDKNLSERFDQIDLFYSTDDEDYILKSVDKILETYPKIHVHKFNNMGHFCEYDMKSNEFPELLKVIK